MGLCYVCGEELPKCACRRKKELEQRWLRSMKDHENTLRLLNRTEGQLYKANGGKADPDTALVKTKYLEELQAKCKDLEEQVEIDRKLMIEKDESAGRLIDEKIELTAKLRSKDETEKECNTLRTAVMELEAKVRDYEEALEFYKSGFYVTGYDRTIKARVELLQDRGKVAESVLTKHKGE